MQKKRKKWVIISCIVVGVILCLLIAGYVAVNVIFSMVSHSFYQSLVSVEQTPLIAATSVPPADGQGGGTSTPAGSSEQTEQELLEMLPGVNPAKLNMTAEEFKALERKIAFNDKLAVLNVLSLGLSAKDYQTVIGLMNDGITIEEVKQGYKIVSENLTEKEKDKIWSYYYKYLHLVQ